MSDWIYYKVVALFKATTFFLLCLLFAISIAYIIQYYYTLRL